MTLTLFRAETWEHRWTYSGYAGTEFGKFMRSSGYFYDDYEVDKGIQTMDDARFYALSRKFAPFSNQGRNLVVQYTVKHEQDIDCGGGYIKLFNCDMEPEQMNGNTPYEIMFGNYSHFRFNIFGVLQDRSNTNTVSVYSSRLLCRLFIISP